MLSIAEASELTGLSKRAIARRIERGQLRATKEKGLRYVETRELAKAGLLDLDGGGRPIWSVQRIDPALLAREVVDVLIRQGIEIHDLRQRIEALEEESRRADRALRGEIEVARREREELRRGLRVARRQAGRQRGPEGPYGAP